jgi:hypoxanthine phosphoribosyltransferase
MPPPGISVLFDADQIAARLRDLAAEIAAAMGPDILLVPILKGSFVFSADLIRALYHAGMRPEVDFLTLSSYGAGRQSSGAVRVARDVDDLVVGRSVLLVDDILESGRTLSFARNLMQQRGAAVVKIAVFLDKPVPRAVPCEADFRAFICLQRFVIGYGLDHAHRYRELPFVGALDGM